MALVAPEVASAITRYLRDVADQMVLYIEAGDADKAVQGVGFILEVLHNEPLAPAYAQSFLPVSDTVRVVAGELARPDELHELRETLKAELRSVVEKFEA